MANNVSKQQLRLYEDALAKIRRKTAYLDDPVKIICKEARRKKDDVSFFTVVRDEPMDIFKKAIKLPPHKGAYAYYKPSPEIAETIAKGTIVAGGILLASAASPIIPLIEILGYGCGVGRILVPGNEYDEVKTLSGTMPETDENDGGNEARGKIEIEETDGDSYEMVMETKMETEEIVESSLTPCWDKIYGVYQANYIDSITETNDGGIVAAGAILPAYSKQDDAQVFKIDLDGDLKWSNTFGGAEFDVLNQVIQTDDGKLAVVGLTRSMGKADSADLWVFGLDSYGNKVWERSYGGNKNDWGTSIWHTSDGGFVVGGATGSKGKGKSDAWILRLDPEGKLLWDKTFGGSNWDGIYSAQQTIDGGYFAAGYSWSKKPSGKITAWAFAIDAQQKIQWDNVYGGEYEEEIKNAWQTSDGGYVMAITTWTPTQDSGLASASILKLKPDRTKEWEHFFDGEDESSVFSVRQTPDGKYIAAGSTGPKKNPNALIFALAANGDLIWHRTFSGRVAKSALQTTDGKIVVAGYTSPKLKASWILMLDEKCKNK